MTRSKFLLLLFTPFFKIKKKLFKSKREKELELIASNLAYRSAITFATTMREVLDNKL